jgi:hypothetical protein
VLDQNDSGYTSWFAAAFNAAGSDGFRIVNASLGSTYLDLAVAPESRRLQ